MHIIIKRLPINLHKTVLILMITGIALTVRAQMPKARLSTPQCAQKVLAAMESDNMNLLAALVHPVKGVQIGDVAEVISSHTGAFSVAEVLKAGGRTPPKYRIVNGYNEEDKGRLESLKDILKDHAACTIMRGSSKVRVLFSSATDRRTNYTGNGSYSMKALSAGQTITSYHINDKGDNMDWEHLLIRTEMYKGRPYVVEIFRAYWTP